MGMGKADTSKYLKNHKMVNREQPTAFVKKSDSCTVLMLHHLAHKHTRSVKSMFPGVALYSATPPCSNIPHVGT